MEYLELIEAITKYGILVVIAAIFLWFYWQDREDARKTGRKIGNFERSRLTSRLKLT
jgi:uncharacterized membrane protein YsdA (DUF1294 family)